MKAKSKQPQSYITSKKYGVSYAFGLNKNIQDDLWVAVKKDNGRLLPECKIVIRKEDFIKIQKEIAEVIDNDIKSLNGLNFTTFKKKLDKYGRIIDQKVDELSCRYAYNGSSNIVPFEESQISWFRKVAFRKALKDALKAEFLEEDQTLKVELKELEDRVSLLQEIKSDKSTKGWILFGLVAFTVLCGIVAVLPFIPFLSPILAASPVIAAIISPAAIISTAVGIFGLALSAVQAVNYVETTQIYKEFINNYRSEYQCDLDAKLDAKVRKSKSKVLKEIMNNALLKKDGYVLVKKINGDYKLQSNFLSDEENNDEYDKDEQNSYCDEDEQWGGMKKINGVYKFQSNFLSDEENNKYEKLSDEENNNEDEQRGMMKKVDGVYKFCYEQEEADIESDETDSENILDEEVFLQTLGKEAQQIEELKFFEKKTEQANLDSFFADDDASNSEVSDAVEEEIVEEDEMLNNKLKNKPKLLSVNPVQESDLIETITQ